MNAFRKINDGDSVIPVLAQIEMPWGFRIAPGRHGSQRPAMRVIEWAMTFAGVVFLACGVRSVDPARFAVFRRCLDDQVRADLHLGTDRRPGFFRVSARGFRPEVQVDRVRKEIRFVSRNPRGRGQVLATVDLDQIIGVGITKSIDGARLSLPDLSDRRRKAAAHRDGNRVRNPVIRKKMDDYVTPAAAEAGGKMAATAA